ncbi:DHA2 family efflux MFS transporter permease subunit [Candidatus Nitrospira allomarina]|uniref:DHA2 family efflux MFS transporter permease subunit n=1 Tax=Candidatus Nitrospira allomarina TaxID=3020900 RepID=A0AA96JZB1_9BACT|nr:DHA2 family efflux MFS transporter permease subunit [Candidatus Nitrospira allomarina]WNM58454.1 DHA2 family efflux MFS transporter permease subunit [Candidatus Nitrospira allomarina]
MFPKRLRGWHFILFNLTLGLAHILVMFNVGSYVALLPHVAGDLEGVLPSFLTWAQTDFMIALALGIPIGRTLSDRYGNNRVFIVAFLVYAVASYIGASSMTHWEFLNARIIQGFAGGLTVFLSQDMLLREYPDRLKSMGLAIWGLFTITPFTIGLPVGGWIADDLGWRYLFYLDVALSLVVVGFMGSLLYGRGFHRQRTRFDFVGFFLLAVILGGIQTLLNMGNDFDWLDSPFLRGVLIVVIVALPCFIIWELGERHPMLDLRLFADRNFTIGVICMVAGFFSIQGLITLLIVQLQLLLGYSSLLAGIALLPMVLLAAPMIAVMHELSKRVEARMLASLNFLGFAVTLYWIGHYDDPQSFDQIFWPMLLEGLFLGSFFTPLTVLTIHRLSGVQMFRAAEAVNLLRIAAGAFGITYQTIVLFRRTPFHQLHLANHFGGRQFASFDVLGRFSSNLNGAGLDAAMVKGKLLALVRQYAGILAMSDAFLLASYMFLGLAALVWLAYPTQLPLHPSQEEELLEMRAEALLEEPL